MISSSMFCTNCGTANVQQAKFWFGCGHALPSGALGASGSLTGLLTHNQELNRRYRIIKQVGKGGFGAVYMAADLPFGNRLVAIKEMSQSGLSQQDRSEERRVGKECRSRWSAYH